MNVLDFRKMKLEKRPITMVTCYDYTSAKLLIAPTSTSCSWETVSPRPSHVRLMLNATTEMMALHTAAVARGTKKFIVGDMPFMSFRKGIPAAMECVERVR